MTTQHFASGYTVNKYPKSCPGKLLNPKIESVSSSLDQIIKTKHLSEKKKTGILHISPRTVCNY